MTDTINVGLMGAGWFGREAHLANLINLDGVQVIAASSRSQESLDQARALAGDQLQTFTDWRQVLEIEAIDAVVIALTNDQHHAAAMSAFQAGKHVLCEKPLGLTIGECNDIIAASEASQRVLQVGHEMRFQRMYQEMKTMVQRGDIGDLHLAVIHAQGDVAALLAAVQGAQRYVLELTGDVPNPAVERRVGLGDGGRHVRFHRCVVQHIRGPWVHRRVPGRGGRIHRSAR